MTTFLVKQLEIPLFEDLDEKAALRAAFAVPAAAIVPVTMDLTELGFIAQHVGIDAGDTVSAIRRFVGGEWRDNTHGPSSSVVGDFGEVLSFLQLFASGQHPLRVVSYRRGAAPSAHSFPTPDFIVQEQGLMGCVEVKTSCSLDYLDFAEIVHGTNNRRRRQLAPCNLIPKRRADALEQLAYDPANPPVHDLVLHDAGALKFPVDFGVAHLHLLHDRRVDALRGHANAARMKTPSDCVANNRTCWDCLEPSSPPWGARAADILSIRMHNAPGRLRLPGSGPPDTRLRWSEAYAQWSGSLWARDPQMTLVHGQRLVSEIESWISVTEQFANSAESIGSDWSHYIDSVVRVRGLRESAARFSTLRASEDTQDAAVETDEKEPNVERVLGDEAALFEQGRPRRVWFKVGEFGVSVYADKKEVEIRSTHPRQHVLSIDDGRLLTGTLVLVALQVFHSLALQDLVVEAELAHVSAIVGKSVLTLGWRVASPGFPAVFAHNRRDHQREKFATAWMIALALGDPRTALGMHSDGRGFLRCPRDLTRLALVKLWP